jgi:uncharacterized protein (TIRG00374 family)
MILLAISVVYYLQIVLATKVLLHGMGYKLPFVDLYLVLTACLPANSITPGKVGIPIRLLLYRKMFELSFSVGTASVILELVLGSAVLSAISLIAVMALFRDMLSNKWLFVLLSSVLVVAVVFIGLMKISIGSSGLRSRFLGHRYIARITDFVIRFKGSVQRTSKRALFVFVVFLLIRVAIRALVTYVVLLRLGYDLSPVAIAGAQSISGLVGVFSMLPVGLGAQDLSSIMLFTRMGLPDDVAALVAMIERALWTLVPFALGVISMNRLGIRWFGSREQIGDLPYQPQNDRV